MAEIQLKTLKIPGLDDTYVIPNGTEIIQSNEEPTDAPVGSFWLDTDAEQGVDIIAEHVANMDNPHNVTCEQIGAAPALASGTYPNCYYREIAGEREWINPPMILNTEYCTTEHFFGKPVYKQVLHIGYLAAGEHAYDHGISDIDECIGIEWINQDYGVYTSYINAAFTQTQIHFNSPWSAGAIKCILSYTKN
jgi:hypothetical protein